MGDARLDGWRPVASVGWRTGPNDEVMVLTADGVEPLMLTDATARVWRALHDASIDLGAGATDPAVERQLGALADAGLIEAVATEELDR